MRCSRCRLKVRKFPLAYYSRLWWWRQLGSHGFTGMFVIHPLSLLFRGFVRATASRTNFLSIGSAQSHDLWRRHPPAQQWTAVSSGTLSNNSMTSVFISFFKNLTLPPCRVSWLILVRCGRGLTSSMPLWPLSWWRPTVAGTAAVVPWRGCDPTEWAWTRHTAWPGPREAPSCLCFDLTSCSMTVLTAWRSYKVTALDWIVWTNLQEKCQCRSANAIQEVYWQILK